MFRNEGENKPVHENPSPLYPLLQVHSKPATASEQIALSSQLSGPSRHSSISGEEYSV